MRADDNDRKQLRYRITSSAAFSSIGCIEISSFAPMERSAVSAPTFPRGIVTTADLQFPDLAMSVTNPLSFIVASTHVGAGRRP